MRISSCEAKMCEDLVEAMSSQVCGKSVWAWEVFLIIIVWPEEFQQELSSEANTKKDIQLCNCYLRFQASLHSRGTHWLLWGHSFQAKDLTSSEERFQGGFCCKGSNCWRMLTPSSAAWFCASRCHFIYRWPPKTLWRLGGCIFSRDGSLLSSTVSLYPRMAAMSLHASPEQWTIHSYITLPSVCCSQHCLVLERMLQAQHHQRTGHDVLQQWCGKIVGQQGPQLMEVSLIWTTKKNSASLVVCVPWCPAIRLSNYSNSFVEADRGSLWAPSIELQCWVWWFFL